MRLTRGYILEELFTGGIGRIIIITGHYGSGKTEFAVSLAMKLAAGKTENSAINKTFGPASEKYSKLALVDLDIVNPYFRSRERRETLEAAGIGVYGSSFDTEVTAELPALGATIRAPLEDRNCRVIVDAGGNDTGAMILNQFTKYFSGDETTVLAVVNANRPDTGTLEGALEHITAIEKITGLTVSGIVNNCHLLRETTAETVRKGHTLCTEVCKASSKRLICNCYPEALVAPDDLTGLTGALMPVGLYMRPSWLDIVVTNCASLHQI